MYKVVSPPPLVKMVGKNIKWGRREGEREEKRKEGEREEREGNGRRREDKGEKKGKEREKGRINQVEK